MLRTPRHIFGCIIAVLLAAPLTLQAQSTVGHEQQISANPFGILLGVFNAEYERKITQSGTIGIGGSLIQGDDEDYFNGDIFYRYYPQGKPLDGWAFGVKMGVTKVTDFGSYFGIGFDLNHSWLMGKNDNFYVGLGFGLKRLYGTPGEDEDPFDDILKIIPTFRVVNVGFTF